MVAVSGNGWVLAPCLVTLDRQFDALWPHRDHASDGSIGDLAHQQEQSDHNPSDGFVDALDVDTDLGPTGAMLEVAETLRLSRDVRINYAIFNGRMVRSYDKPGIPAWTWAPYTGADPHTSHLHLSIKKTSAARQDVRPWPLIQQEDDMTPEQAVKFDKMDYAIESLLLPAVGRLEQDAAQTKQALAAIEAAIAKLPQSKGG